MSVQATDKSSSSSQPAQPQAKAKARTNSKATAKVTTAKKRTTLKERVSSKKPADHNLLGGADYVSLLLGGRRKAGLEAAKLAPPDSVP
jgi:hypothetical protein